ncbi:MAG: PQQ-dependent sugar dehydrogenase [Novosphingobium sp.]|nr:PQQ-dependent sugar dehydrogenase [Novosphingobium sp.]
MKTLISTLALALTALPLASCNAAPAQPGGGKTSAKAGLQIEEYGTFEEPWALAFAPGTSVVFVTERKGSVKFVDTATRRTGTVTGVPKVDYGGQGGLGDIAFLPGESSPTLSRRTIYLSWAEAGSGDTRGAVVGRGTLICEEADACRIDAMRVIWRQSPKVTGRGHYAHRLLFSPDGQYLYVASGDRQKFTPAQDMESNLGKIVRLTPDGTPAPGNPFAARGGVAAEVWSLGHRNILGLGWDSRDRLWGLEHGPAGGDEFNLITAGANYGWPVVSDGDHYDGRDIPAHSTRPDFAAPAIGWNPVIAPGGFIFYRGNAFPSWKGEAIIADMANEGLVRVQLAGNKAREVERIPLGKRIRAVVEGPDGAIWIAEDKSGARLRKLTPKR